MPLPESLPDPNSNTARRHRQGRGWLLPVVAGVVVLTAATAFVGIDHGLHQASAGGPRSTAGSVAGSSVGSAARSTPGSASATSVVPSRSVGGPTLQAPVPVTRAAAGPAVPVRVQVPKLGIDSSLQPLGLLKDGTLESPSKWQVAGYYDGGPRPGQVGPAVIAGHVDSVGGPAVFYRLVEMKPGDQAIVTTKTGQRLKFVVTEVDSYPKTHFPTELVYGPTPLPELRLITCTGDFDYVHRSYLNNLVVSLVLAGDRLG